MNRWLLIIFAALAWFAWRDWSHREIVHPPGVLVKQQPVQRNLATPSVFPMNDFQLTQRASFEIRARVLSTEAYRWGVEAQLSPVDLALGWGVMSDQAVLDLVKVTQGNRWYFTRYKLPAPIADKAIIGNSSNMHIIPADQWIEKEVKTLRSGDVVNLRGFLVDVANPSGFKWRTSLSREDTGSGSCEIFFVEFVQREDRT